MYEYIFVKADIVGVFTSSNYKELIIENSKKGYRFVTAIPRTFNSHGHINTVDLVFEKPIS